MNKTTKTSSTVEVPNSFLPVLNELQNGHCVGELSEKLEELIAAVKLQNASGGMTLAITFKPTNGGETMLVTPKITVKMPKTPERTTMFYTTENNLLQRQDPNQRELELREVPKEPAAPLRTLETAVAV